MRTRRQKKESAILATKNRWRSTNVLLRSSSNWLAITVYSRRQSFWINFLKSLFFFFLNNLNLRNWFFTEKLGRPSSETISFFPLIKLLKPLPLENLWKTPKIPRIWLTNLGRRKMKEWRKKKYKIEGEKARRERGLREAEEEDLPYSVCPNLMSIF